MRIGMHLVLSTLAATAGFLAGSLLTALLLEVIRGCPQWVVVPSTVIALIGFCVGGVRGGEALVRLLPARCPDCRGRAFPEGHRPVRFRCKSCQRIHRTRMRVYWGGD
jgi:hypothetical protein